MESTLVLSRPFGTANTRMTNSNHPNDARDNGKLASLEIPTLTRDIESPKDNFGISGDDTSIVKQVRNPGVIDRQIESREDDSVGKEYIPPLPTWKLFTIVFGCVQIMPPTHHMNYGSDAR